MKARLVSLALFVALLSTFVLAPAGAEAAPKTAAAVDIPVTGTIPVIGGTFEGVFTLTEIVAEDGELFAVGTLTGTLTDALGNVIGTVEDLPITLPLSGVTGTCEILDLTLGPLDLDLLGLVVHLDQVHLTIDAESGPGNLLGNLLCAVAHLLDSNASANALANLLNRILGLLG